MIQQFGLAREGKRGFAVSGAGKLPPRREIDQRIGGKALAARSERERNWNERRYNVLTKKWFVEQYTMLQLQEFGVEK